MKSARGSALVFTIIGLAVVTVMGLAMTAMGISSMSMAAQEGQTREALAVADAGIEHSKRLLLWQEWNSLNQFLQRGDAAGCSWDEFTGAPTGTLPADYPTDAADFIPQGGRAFGDGVYTVSLCDNHLEESAAATPDTDPNADADKTALLRSVAVMANGSRAAVEVLLAARALPAISVNGDLEVKGSPTVSGPAGSIHSNGTLLVSGTPCTHQYYSSNGDVATSGSVKGGPACTTAGVDARPYSPPLNIAILHPSDYVAFADYQLRPGPGTKGWIYDKSGMFLAEAPWNGWSYNSNPAQTWSFNGPVPAGTYYVDGNVSVAGNPTAADGSPLPMSFLIEGSFMATGSPSLTPVATIPTLGQVMIIAGTDINMGGSNTLAGLFYAQDQIEMSGSPTINGQLVAANHDDDPFPGPKTNPNHNPVPLSASGRMELTGSPTVNYSGNGMQSVQSVSWRECRGEWVGAAPGSPCGNP